MKQTDFINIPAVNWAKANIREPISNNPEWGKFIFLFSFFGISVILFIVLAFVFAGREADEYTFFQRVFLRNAFLALLFLPFWIMFYLSYKSFKRKIKTIDSEGVITVLNKKFKWENLYFVNFATYSNYTRRAGTRGRKLNIIEVFFEKGMVDTFYTNQKIVDLLIQIPAQKRKDGKVQTQT